MAKFTKLFAVTNFSFSPQRNLLMGADLSPEEMHLSRGYLEGETDDRGVRFAAPRKTYSIGDKIMFQTGSRADQLAIVVGFLGDGDVRVILDETAEFATDRSFRAKIASSSEAVKKIGLKPAVQERAKADMGYFEQQGFRFVVDQADMTNIVAVKKGDKALYLGDLVTAEVADPYGNIDEDGNLGTKKIHGHIVQIIPNPQVNAVLLKIRGEDTNTIGEVARFDFVDDGPQKRLMSRGKFAHTLGPASSAPTSEGRALSA